MKKRIIPIPIVRLASLRCRCGSAQIVAVKPGDVPALGWEHEVNAAGERIGTIVQGPTPEVPDEAWCAACWPASWTDPRRERAAA